MLRFDSFRVRAFASCSLVLALCLACNTMNVQQSSLVPAPTLPPMPAHDGKLDVYLGSSTVTGVSRPDLTASDSGLWIPRTQLDGALSYRPTRRFAMRADWLLGFSADAQALAGTALPNPGREVWGLGLGVTGRFDEPGEAWFVDVSADMIVLSVPSHIRVTCDAPCGIPAFEDDQRDSVPLLSLGAVAGYRIAPEVALVFSTGLRNHPTNSASFTSTEADATVLVGPTNWLVGVGAQFRVTPWLGLSPMVQLPITANPVRYAPILTLGVNFTMPDEPQPAQPWKY